MRDRGQAEKSALDGGRYRARVQGVVAEIGAIVDPRHDDVVLKIEQAGNCQMHTIGRRAVDVVRIRVKTRRAHRDIEGQ